MTMAQTLHGTEVKSLNITQHTTCYQSIQTYHFIKLKLSQSDAIIGESDFCLENFTIL